MILGDKITELRKRNGWSQEELAEKLNLSRQSVSKWENGTSIPDLDRILKLSELFDVSTDYLLREDLEEPAPAEGDTVYREEAGRSVSLEEANGYLSTVKAVAGQIALAVAFCVFSPVCLIVLAGLSEYQPGAFGGGLSEKAAAGFGTAVLLLIVAASVCVLILDGMKLSRYKYMEEEVLSLQYGVQGIFEKQKAAFEPVFAGSIAGGVALILVGVALLMVAVAMDAGEMALIWCVALLLTLIAVAVFLFVRSSMEQEAYHKLLQLEDYTPENKTVAKRYGAFSGIYWCCVVALYLGVSFATDSWERSWVIWPVAGVLFAAVWGCVKLLGKKEEQK